MLHLLLPRRIPLEELVAELVVFLQLGSNFPLLRLDALEHPDRLVERLDVQLLEDPRPLRPGMHGPNEDEKASQRRQRPWIGQIQSEGRMPFWGFVFVVVGGRAAVVVVVVVASTGRGARPLRRTIRLDGNAVPGVWASVRWWMRHGVATAHGGIKHRAVGRGA